MTTHILRNDPAIASSTALACPTESYAKLARLFERLVGRAPRPTDDLVGAVADALSPLLDQRVGRARFEQAAWETALAAGR